MYKYILYTDKNIICHGIYIINRHLSSDNRGAF